MMLKSGNRPLQSSGMRDHVNLQGVPEIMQYLIYLYLYVQVFIKLKCKLFKQM